MMSLFSPLMSHSLLMSSLLTSPSRRTWQQSLSRSHSVAWLPSDPVRGSSRQAGRFWDSFAILTITLLLGMAHGRVDIQLLRSISVCLIFF